MEKFNFGDDVIVNGKQGKVIHYLNENTITIDINGMWESHSVEEVYKQQSKK